MFDFKEFEQKFIYYFGKYNLEFDERIINRFYLFADFLTRENEKYNLTAIRDLDGIIIKHFVDSAIILNYADLCENIIDIGAGAGFPSVPIAICTEYKRDLKISCVDSSAKKINFVKNAAELLELKNLDCFCGRAEDLNSRERYNSAVSRAVARLNILCEFAAPVLKIGGIFCAYKSKSAYEELKECKNAFKILGLELSDYLKFELETEERAFIIIKKISETPEKYPRNFSQITKIPL